MLNNIILIGRLCGDPEYRTTQSGVPVASFRLAVERNFIDKQTGQRQTDFIDCVCWRGTADFCQRHFFKGQQAAVQGRLETRNYEDKNGNRRTAYEVQVESLHFADSKREGEYRPPDDRSPPQEQYKKQAKDIAYGDGGNNQDDDFTPVNDDDLPF